MTDGNVVTDTLRRKDSDLPGRLRTEMSGGMSSG